MPPPRVRNRPTTWRPSHTRPPGADHPARDQAPRSRAQRPTPAAEERASKSGIVTVERNASVSSIHLHDQTVICQTDLWRQAGFKGPVLDLMRDMAEECATRFDFADDSHGFGEVQM